MRAEDLPGGLGAFRVVSFAQSFHWLDRPRVAAAVRRMLVPDGVCVFVHATTHEGIPGDDVLPHPRPPREAIVSLVRDYLGPLRRAGRGVLPQGSLSGEGDIFRAAGFQEPTRLDVAGGLVVERSADEAVASVFSLSSAAPHLFGDRRGVFERDLRGLLRETSTTGRFSERTHDIRLELGNRNIVSAHAPAGVCRQLRRFFVAVHCDAPYADRSTMLFRAPPSSDEAAWGSGCRMDRRESGPCGPTTVVATLRM